MPAESMVPPFEPFCPPTPDEKGLDYRERLIAVV
jgi:hypothetical protein